VEAAASYLRPYCPHEITDLLVKIELQPADFAQCNVGREMAARMIHPGVASAATLRRIQARTRAAVFVQTQNEVVVGVSGALPLTPSGLGAVEGHQFEARDPADDHLCAPGDPLAAVYAWAFAATTRKASAAVVMMMIRLREHYSDIPFFTRAVTPTGAKVVRGRMGYSPYPGAPDDLLWNPVRPLIEERAA